MVKFYTGVGSRETPKDILEYIRKVGKRMAELNYIGRSGSADGADYYFELGYFDYLKDAQTNNTECLTLFNSYIPWNNFKTKHGVISVDRYHSCPQQFSSYKEAKTMVSTIHPAYNKLTSGALALHTRNIYQVLGDSLDSPSKVLFCYAQPTKTGVKGGTNTAYQLALRHNIPCYNFYKQEDIDKINKLLNL